MYLAACGSVALIHVCCRRPKIDCQDSIGANTATIKSVNGATCLDIELRQSKFLDNIVEQGVRAVKRITDPLMGFKSFWSVQKLISGTETMHMVKKGQLQGSPRVALSRI